MYVCVGVGVCVGGVGVQVLTGKSSMCSSTISCVVYGIKEIGGHPLLRDFRNVSLTLLLLSRGMNSETG